MMVEQSAVTHPRKKFSVHLVEAEAARLRRHRRCRRYAPREPCAREPWVREPRLPLVEDAMAWPCCFRPSS
jgi:hypothetical protein